MTEWVAWVEIADLRWLGSTELARSRYYVTHGFPFLQLTPFRSAAARYGSEFVAENIAEMAAGPVSPRGAEQVPRRLIEPDA
jgi:hypothetical protein